MQWNTFLRPAGSPFVALRRDLERQLGQESGPAYAGMTVLESEDRYTVCVDLPGLSEAEIAVSVQDGMLVIEGERPAFAAAGSREVFNDRTSGKFRRVLKIRDGVDTSSIEADLQNGVLTLTLKRAVEAGRRIVVRAKAQPAVSPSVPESSVDPEAGPRDFE